MFRFQFRSPSSSQLQIISLPSYTDVRVCLYSSRKGFLPRVGLKEVCSGLGMGP